MTTHWDPPNSNPSNVWMDEYLISFFFEIEYRNCHNIKGDTNCKLKGNHVILKSTKKNQSHRQLENLYLFCWGTHGTSALKLYRLKRREEYLYPIPFFSNGRLIIYRLHQLKYKLSLLH